MTYQRLTVAISRRIDCAKFASIASARGCFGPKIDRRFADTVGRKTTTGRVAERSAHLTSVVSWRTVKCQETPWHARAVRKRKEAVRINCSEETEASCPASDIGV